MMAAAGGVATALAAVAGTPSVPAGPSQSLRETGLYADFATLTIDPRHIGYAPQYPLWTDGAAKRRWISLPPGTAIDASDPEAWVFPVGTRFWKEFSFAGRRVETRYLERLADGWRYAAYEWTADGREATLVSERGRRGAFPLGERRAHTIPSVTDCKVCHEASRPAVLGFSLLQLSPDRDPGAPHADAPPAPAPTSTGSSTPGCWSGCPTRSARRRRGSPPPRRPSGRRSATCTATAGTATTPPASSGTSGCSCAMRRTRPASRRSPAPSAGR